MFIFHSLINVSVKVLSTLKYLVPLSIAYQLVSWDAGAGTRMTGGTRLLVNLSYRNLPFATLSW